LARRDLARLAVPAQHALLEATHVLHEGSLPVQPRARDRLADRAAELGHDRLLRLADGEEAAAQEQDGGEERQHDEDRREPHLPPSPGRPDPSGSGRSPFTSSSTTIFRAILGSTRAIVSSQRRRRVTSGAFWYSARTARKRCVSPVARLTRSIA